MKAFAQKSNESTGKLARFWSAMKHGFKVFLKDLASLIRDLSPKTVARNFKSSMGELSRPQGIAVAAMFLALRVVLGASSNFSLNLSPDVKIGFSFLPQALSGALLGPVVGGLVGAFGDIFSYILNPAGGGYFPGWTLNSMLNGMIFGIFLYKKQMRTSETLLRTIIARIIIAVFIELLIGTFWRYVQAGVPYIPTLSLRAAKQLIFTPIEIVIIFTLLKALYRIKIFK